MPENWLQRAPVIVGVGEIVDFPSDPVLSKEPLCLMAEALRRADEDANGGWLKRINSLVVINSMTWGYNDLPAQLSESLGIHPARTIYGAIGGDSPIAYLHEAAIQIAQGDSSVVAICGAEASHSLARAQHEKIALPWTPGGPKPGQPQREGVLHPLALRHGLNKPLVVYPLYEYATRSAWGQSFREWETETSEMWSQLSSVAAKNPYSWLRRVFEPSEISTPSQENRMVAGPYTKHMVANSIVNQGAAILVTSYAAARSAGISDDQLVFVWGGSSASEPHDFVSRDQYRNSTAMEAVLTAATRLPSRDQAEFEFAELYSCFPCVPKMARRVLNWPADKLPTVTGGLSFFGGPYNNYMTHATAAMTRSLRGQHQAVGLLYGQGGFVTKHHALVVATRPPSGPLAPNYDVQPQVDCARGKVPDVNGEYVGDAVVETYTIIYDRHGSPEYGVVFARTEKGSRIIARVEAKDNDTITFLLDPRKRVIDASGSIRQGNDGLQRWTI